jgi:hypothetical protein
MFKLIKEFQEFFREPINVDPYRPAIEVGEPTRPITLDFMIFRNDEVRFGPAIVREAVPKLIV